MTMVDVTFIVMVINAFLELRFETTTCMHP